MRLPKENEMKPRDKYTTFNRTSKGFRKSVHKVSKSMTARQSLSSRRSDERRNLCLVCAKDDRQVTDTASHKCHTNPSYAGSEMDKNYTQNESTRFLEMFLI